MSVGLIAGLADSTVIFHITTKSFRIVPLEIRHNNDIPNTVRITRTLISIARLCSPFEVKVSPVHAFRTQGYLFTRSDGCVSDVNMESTAVISIAPAHTANGDIGFIWY